ncbi:MAG TPA: penicillin acylase family protein [Chitinophaga sp.]|uniref:penicillin acylase family protein n=1 Tax=Chitinophaga sp. TaxID=1869181 RepID=UPI002DB83118|nr:penicillin acylase family protein [Chitinophaga sp.]HEU4555000.1 penicillin acylase family protein [Chitinophaga sp.]
MKRYILAIFILALTAAWLILSSVNYAGLNSLQRLANYRNGILAGEGEWMPRSTVITAKYNAHIDIDTLGIPHIFSKDANGSAYALGFMHAKDRYFQMEVTAYAVMGKLGELFGEAAVSSDRHWRKFELEDRAKAYFNSLAGTQPALYSYLQAYEAGVNDYIQHEAPRRRDPMYTIWHCSPHPWKAYYTFLVQWYMSHELTFYDDYFDKQELLDKLPDTIRQLLYPSNPDKENFIVPGGALQPTLKERSLARVFDTDSRNNYTARPFNKNLGSNNWVVGSAHTTQGQLFLCNDLHLSLATPNIFYEAHLSSPGMHVYGFTIPGVPVVLTGHNEKIAWGITNGGWDVTEQYLLKLDPAHPDRYWLNGKWETMKEKKFLIGIKGKAAEAMTVKYTVFGPLVQRDSVAYGLKWHPQESCQAVESFWKLMHAGNWDDFRTALRSYDYPSQNFVYGDVNGNIGIICAGKMPVKPAGYAGGVLDGTVSPHWSYVPFDSLPQSYNPGRNYLFSANQEPARNGIYFSSRWFDDLYRPERINEMLSAAKQLDREDMRRMQLDVKDLSVKDLQQLIKMYAPEKKLSPEWALMKDWNGDLQPNSRPAVFYKYIRWSVKKVSADMAKQLNLKAAPGYDQFMRFLMKNARVEMNGGVIESRQCFDKIITTTDSLFARLGHAATPVNPYAFNIPQLTHLPALELQVGDVGGSENTINVNYRAHPVIRTLIEINHGHIQSWMVNATGQTGRINEKNYLQQFAAWKKNDLHPSQFVRQEQQLHAIVSSIQFVQQH